MLVCESAETVILEWFDEKTVSADEFIKWKNYEALLITEVMVSYRNPLPRLNIWPLALPHPE